ncbi:50S ribosomal protein L25, partial [Actinomycetota bacterium]
EVEADVTNIPAFLMLSMEGMMAGDSRYASDVVIPEGVKLISDPKMTVVHLSVRAAEEEVVVVAAAPAEVMLQPLLPLKVMPQPLLPQPLAAMIRRTRRSK